MKLANEVSVKKTISTISVNTVDMFLTTIKQTFIKTYSSNKYQYFGNSRLMNVSLASIPNASGRSFNLSISKLLLPDSTLP